MTTDELIKELQDYAEVEGHGTLYNLLLEVAEQLALLDERVSIMQEGTR